jgi:8-oxo-dGTP diphosphatase
MYSLPGGGVDIGEDLEAAVVREVKEETGIDVEVVKLIAVRSSIFTSAHDEVPQNYHSLLFYYVCKKTGGELSTDGFDDDEKIYAEMAEWVPIERIDEITTSGTVDCKPIIKEAIAYGD